MRLIAAAVLLTLQLVESSPVSHSRYVLHEARSASSSLKRHGQSIDSDAIVPIKISLAQSNLETGYDRLVEVPHPGSPTFGKHLPEHEVNTLFAPAQSSVNAVRSWLVETTGVKETDVLLSLNRGWLAIDLPVRDAERIFQARYYEPEDINGRMRIGWCQVITGLEEESGEA